MDKAIYRGESSTFPSSSLPTWHAWRVDWSKAHEVVSYLEDETEEGFNLLLLIEGYGLVLVQSIDFDFVKDVDYTVVVKEAFYYHVDVKASSLEEAKKKAFSCFMDGDVEDYETSQVSIEEVIENGR